MAGVGRMELSRFVEELRRLRRSAGAPTLNRLAELTAGSDRPLSRSTVSDKLTEKSLPDWDFVISFVTACQTHAEKSGVVLPADLADLARWDTEHWRLLQALDESRETDRLVAAARTGLDRRPVRGTGQPVPRQLPAPVRHFAGRKAELDTLDALLGEPATVVISAIDGMAGIGKTARRQRCGIDMGWFGNPHSTGVIAHGG